MRGMLYLIISFHDEIVKGIFFKGFTFFKGKLSFDRLCKLHNIMQSLCQCMQQHKFYTWSYTNICFFCKCQGIECDEVNIVSWYEHASNHIEVDTYCVFNFPLGLGVRMFFLMRKWGQFHLMKCLWYINIVRGGEFVSFHHDHDNDHDHTHPPPQIEKKRKELQKMLLLWGNMQPSTGLSINK